MTLLRARVLTPTSPTEVRWIPDAQVRVEDGVFTSVEPWKGGSCDRDLRPWVLTPGFVDSHLHFPQTRIVGAASGPLLQWLATSTFPEEARFADLTHAEQVAEVFCQRLLAAGTTRAMVYSSVHQGACEALFAALERHRIRAVAGPVLMDRDCPEELQVPVGPALEALERLRELATERVQLGVIPRFALSCSREMLQAAGEFSRDHGLWCTTHLSENLEECRIARESFAASDYLSIYEDAGMVHDRSVYAHCIHLSESELDRMAAADVIVAHCPDSNDFLGSGGMPLQSMQERGMRVAIGTDVAAGRSFRIPRILSSAYDNGLRQGVTLDPRHLLWLGTHDVLGLGGGRLEAGQPADWVAHDVPEWAQTEDEVLGWVMFDHDARITGTWIDGEPAFAG